MGNTKLISTSIADAIATNDNSTFSKR